MYEYAEPAAPAAGFDIAGAFSIMVILTFLLYCCFMQYKIAHKTGQSDIAWWAFIPVLNTLLLLKMAEKPLWWLLLLLVPFVNMVAFFALWMAAARNAGQSAVWGFLVMIPLLNLVALFVLAFGSREYEYPDDYPAGPSNRPRQPQQVGR